VNRYVAIAEVARPHGVQGELRLKLYNEESEVLLERPRVRLVCGDGAVREVRVKAVRQVPGALLVRLDGIDDRDAAETVRGARIEVPRELLPPPGEGELYVCDLEGCRVRVAGNDVGAVVGVASYPSCDALVVELDAGRRVEVPLVDTNLVAVDLEARVVELASLGADDGEPE
jgi:16S rRNA processing protein RimM